MSSRTSQELLDSLDVIPRILLTTDGTLTHILEAYAAERVYLVKLAHAFVTDPAARAEFDLVGRERAVRRVILLRGDTSDTPYLFADSVVMLDRLPPLVAAGLLDTDTPIGKLLFSSRAETFRRITELGEEHDPGVAAHFDMHRGQPLVYRTYQIVLDGRPIACIKEKFPKASFQSTEA
jgi:chorismate-pyruvate lyase